MSAIKYYHLQQTEITEELELIDNDLRESMRETNKSDWSLIDVNDKPCNVCTPHE